MPVIARKLESAEKSETLPLFSSLSRRPRGFVHANSLASKVTNSNHVRKLKDGPYGGTPLVIGEESLGESVTAFCHADGLQWGAVRISDFAVAQTAFALSQSQLWLPGSAESLELGMHVLGRISKLGFVHRDITGPAPRGPFDKIAPSSTATYPALWNHDAQNETCIVCAPDSQLQVRQGMEEKAATIWATASRAHENLDFRYNSQPLGVAFTDQESIGGRAWPNVVFTNARFEFVHAVWGNSTLGLISHWWHANRQQSGRGTTTIRAVESLPVLDFLALNDHQLLMAELIFDEFREKELQPAYLADADPNRALLDRRVIRDLLGFDKETYEAVRRLAAKWCAEPSVHGGKPRPKGSKLVV